MARIRTIKPEFFTSTDIVSLSPLARLLYIGLWCEADRQGRMKWRPADFKLRILPGDQVDIQALCAELVEQGLVRLYGDRLAYIPAFADHQHVNPREAQSKLPEPPEIDAHTTRDDASNLDVHQQVGKEGKGKEGNDSEPNGSGASAPSALEISKQVFDEGVALLTKRGTPEKQARSLIGKWRSQATDTRIAELIREATAKNITEPIEWFVKALQGNQRETYEQRRQRENLAVIESYEHERH